MRLRFAPSPTGQLHVGNARTALFNWLLARGAGGTFVLRIEDTDRRRSTRESEAAIYDDLRWMGLDWDEGPDAGGPYGPYRQSERLHLYETAARQLLDRGDAYHCFCTPDQLEAERREALAAGRPPRYSGRCRSIDRAEADRRLAAGEAAAIRFRVPAIGDVAFDDLVRGRVVFHTDVIGDPVILRSDGHPAYNFAVVVDDARMEVTDVVRGEDHVSNTPRQILIYRALGFAPPRFAHLSLVLGPDHSPLSKRHGATSVAEFRARGYLPEALVNYLALIGWSAGGADEILPVGELIRRFSLDAVGHSAGVFDEEKLAWVNRHYLKTADPDRLVSLVVPFLAEEGLAIGAIGEGARAWLTSIVPPLAATVDRLSQIPERLRVIFHFEAATALARPEMRGELEAPAARAVAGALARRLADAPRLVDRETFRASVAAVRESTGQKGRALLHPIRVMLTGEPEGPELDLVVPAIDRGADLPAGEGLAPIVGCRERAAAMAAGLSLKP